MGYTMWDYESDAPRMWPEEQKYPTIAEEWDVLDRNPEGAAPRGKWADVDFLLTTLERNSEMKDTQFADYHGHGWNFRGVYKRDRKGNLLDDKGSIVADDDPENSIKRFICLLSIWTWGCIVLIATFHRTIMATVICMEKLHWR